MVGFYIGAAIGSFLNVVIYRMPRGLSLSNPKHSFCPNCKHKLDVLDLFPLVSWVLLGGKCRHCKAKVAARYFVVELLTGGIWGGIWWLYLVKSAQPAQAIALSLFASALVAAIFIDLAFFIIPDQVNAWMLLCGVGLNVWTLVQHDTGSMLWGMPSSVAGWLVGTGIIWSITLLGRVAFGKDAMGHGDIKMARGIGAVLLPIGAALSIAMAVGLGAVLGIFQAIWLNRMRKKHPEPEQETEDDEPYVPESIGSILWCGIGYFLCIDAIGLLFPKLYVWWFKEDPYAVESVDDEFEIEPTMIPFGPYLAAGALIVVLLHEHLFAWVAAYFAWTGI